MSDKANKTDSRPPSRSDSVEGGRWWEPLSYHDLLPQSQLQQSLGYPCLFAPATPIHPESNKFQELMLKRQRRENKIPKNVLCEFKSEDVSGHKFEDLDAVLQSLGEAGEEKKKGQVKKKKKAEKGNMDCKKGRHSVQKEGKQWQKVS